MKMLECALTKTMPDLYLYHDKNFSHNTKNASNVTETIPDLVITSKKAVLCKAKRSPSTSSVAVSQVPIHIRMILHLQQAVNLQAEAEAKLSPGHPPTGDSSSTAFTVCDLNFALPQTHDLRRQRHASNVSLLLPGKTHGGVPKRT